MMAGAPRGHFPRRGGFLKVLVEEQGERILGFTAVGPEAGELLPVVQLAMRVELPYTAITDLVVTHPTMAEGLVSLFRPCRRHGNRGPTA